MLKVDQFDVEDASPVVVLPRLRVFDGDGFLTNWQKRTNPWIMPVTNETRGRR
jgi:hypothetical protein